MGCDVVFRRPFLEDGHDNIAHDIDLTPDLIAYLSNASNCALQCSTTSCVYIALHNIICEWTWTISSSRYIIAHTLPIRAIYLYDQYLITTDGSTICIWSIWDLTCLDRIHINNPITDIHVIDIIYNSNYIYVSIDEQLYRYQWDGVNIIFIDIFTMKSSIQCLTQAIDTQSWFAAIIAPNQLSLYRNDGVTCIMNDCVTFCRNNHFYIVITRSQLHIIDSNGDGIRCIKLRSLSTHVHSHGSCIAVADCNGNIYIYDTGSLQLQRIIAPEPSLGHVQIKSIKVTSRSNPSISFILLVVYSNGVVHVLDLTAARIIAERPSIRSRIVSACLVRSAAAFACTDRSLSLWQKSQLSWLPITFQPTWQCCTGPHQLVLGDTNGLIRYLDIRTGDVKHGLDLSPSGIITMISMNGYLAIYQKDHRIILLNDQYHGITIQDSVKWRTGSVRTSPRLDMIPAISSSTTLTLLYSTLDDTVIQQCHIDLHNNHIISRHPLTASESIITFALHPSYRYIVIALRSGCIEYRDFISGKVIGCIDGRATGIRFDSTGAFMILYDDDGDGLHIIQFGTGRRIASLPINDIKDVLVHQNQFYCIGTDYISQWRWPSSVLETMKYVRDLIGDLDLNTFWSRYQVNIHHTRLSTSVQSYQQPIIAKLQEFFVKSTESDLDQDIIKSVMTQILDRVSALSSMPKYQ